MESETSLVDSILEKRWLTHSIFWISLLVIYSAYFTSFGRSFHFHLITNLGLLPSQMTGAYFLSYFLIPKFLYKKKYVLFACLFCVSTYTLAIIARIISVYVVEPFTRGVTIKESLQEILLDPLYILTVYVPWIYFFPVLMAALKIIKDKYKEREQIEILQKEKARAELNSLRAQIHPHFLLNTLNNLYALTVKKSDKAPETVIKLSEMLTYILYKCNGKYVSLADEIKLIDNYISLEELRYTDNLRLSFSKEISDPSARIAPLILLSLVENAFKHGVSGEVDEAEVRIDLKLVGEDFSFEVFNTKSEIKQTDQTEYTKGIGVSNVRKQLDLVYPERYSFDIDEEEKSYKILLKLNLSENEN